MRWYRRHKIIFTLLSLFILVGIFFTLFHHHEDGQEHQDCFVCRLIQQCAGFFLGFIAVLLLVIPQARQFVQDSQKKLLSFLSPSNLHGRAPPALS